MRQLTVVLSTIVLSVALIACGSTATTTSSSSNTATSRSSATGKKPADASNPTSPSDSTTSASAAKDAADGDTDSNSDDDREVFDFGKAANASDQAKITALVKRYYTAAANDDGATVCAQIYSLMAEAIVEDYGELAGPRQLRGKTCAVVESKDFKLYHHLWAKRGATMEVIGVRTKGKKGLVVLRFGKKATPRYLPVRVEFGAWKVYSISDDSPLP